MNGLVGKIIGGITGLALLALTAGCDDGYGCKEEDYLKQETPGYYTGKVDCRYFLNRTGIMVKDGDTVNLDAAGTCCWSDYGCSSPDGSASTWGLYWQFWSKDGQTMYDYAKVGSTHEEKLFLPGQEEFELYLVIPEGYNKMSCYEYDYVNNSGKYDVTVSLRRD